MGHPSSSETGAEVGGPGHEFIERLERRRGVSFAKRFDDDLGGNVSDEVILGEGTAAESSESRVEASATSVEGGEDLGFSFIAARVKMQPDVVVLETGDGFADERGDLFRLGDSDGVGQRNGTNAEVGDVVERGDDFVDVPDVSVGIAEGHRNVNHHVESGVVGLLYDGFQRLVILFRRLILILAKERIGERVRVAEGGNGLGGYGAVGTLGVDDDSDDLDVVRRIELLEDVFA